MVGDDDGALHDCDMIDVSILILRMIPLIFYVFIHFLDFYRVMSSGPQKLLYYGWPYRRIHLRRFCEANASIWKGESDVQERSGEDL